MFYLKAPVFPRGRDKLFGFVMELGFSEKQACPVNSEQNIYIHLEYVERPLQVIRSKEEAETVKIKWRHP